MLTQWIAAGAVSAYAAGFGAAVPVAKRSRFMARQIDLGCVVDLAAVSVLWPILLLGLALGWTACRWFR